MDEAKFAVKKIFEFVNQAPQEEVNVYLTIRALGNCLF